MPEPEKDEKLKKAYKDKVTIINRIEEKSNAIEFFKTSDKPILKLKESK